MTLTQKSKCIADEAVINILTLSMVLGNQKRSDAPCSKNTFGCMKVQSDSDKTVELASITCFVSNNRSGYNAKINNTYAVSYTRGHIRYMK